ncbi:cell division protein FtsL [Sporomusaceae bacterium BoRhaA]|uniref:cell division protein FtsL n=1 Tax=Pelorhabdus rhamnosifermentans TaxID=2772457 RepID=UPI001C060441|nr:cell division protein FtsL [Pelorhabdus rhamnosifermentans]MBU2702995.1 cell division protein FtsL [Pelorhabdus rhamnosifermentans]
MLVSKKQEWELIEQPDEQIVPSLPRTRLDVQRRRKYFVFVTVLALMAVILTMQSEFVVRSGYELVKMKTQVASLEKENEVLHLDVAKLKSPARIERIAKKELGMVLPSVVYHAQASSEGNLSQTNMTATAAKNNKTTPALGMN